MPGWTVAQTGTEEVVWRDAVGDAISLTFAPPFRSLPALSNVPQLRDYCRRRAEEQAAGLVEVTVASGAVGPSLVYVYKRLKIPAFTFFGVLLTPLNIGTWIWMIVAQERGTTGVREALITTRLFEAGELTLESYESSWAQDPYDPSYSGVDRSTLRYRSDAEEYDDEVPNHPLSKVRRELRRLLTVALQATGGAYQAHGPAERVRFERKSND